MKHVAIYPNKTMPSNGQHTVGAKQLCVVALPGGRVVKHFKRLANLQPRLPTSLQSPISTVTNLNEALVRLGPFALIRPRVGVRVIPL